MAELFDNRERADGFGAAAQAYDRFRPSYPAALIDFFTTDGPGVALDVACGTGQLTTMLSDAGWEVTGVEADPRMCEVARSKGLRVETSRFEQWVAPAEAMFDLVTSAQAWHWIDPVAGSARAAELLAPGGRIGIIWNTYWYPSEVTAVFHNVIGALAPDLLAEDVHLGTTGLDYDQLGRRATDAMDDRFESIESHIFDHGRDQSIADWIGESRTHSPVAALDEAVREPLLESLASELDAVVDRSIIPVRYQTLLSTALRSGHP